MDPIWAFPSENFFTPFFFGLFLYFDHFHIFDIFCTSIHRLYFDQNCISTCTSRPIRSPDLTKRSKYRGRSKVEKIILKKTQLFQKIKNSKIRFQTEKKYHDRTPRLPILYPGLWRLGLLQFAIFCQIFEKKYG